MAHINGNSHFNLEYHNETIRVEIKDNQYRLLFPGDRWLVINKEDDYSKTIASSDTETRQNIPSAWVVLSTSGGPDWINREQLQVLGELISRKMPEQVAEKESAE